MVRDSLSGNIMNESNPSDAALAELLSLTVTVNSQGATMYRNHLGQFHRIHGPAVIYANGSEYWFRHDRLHRVDGPAINWADGTRSWYLDDQKLTEEQWNERIRSL